MQTLPNQAATQPMIGPMRRSFPATPVTRIRVCLLLALTWVSTPLCARAGTIRDDRDPQAYLNLAAAPEYASVGRFDLTKWEPGFSASGTLIDDNWILTAAHVMEGTTSGQFTVGGRSYGVSKWVTHPKWDGALRRGNDLALVKLDGTVSDVAPAALYTGKREFNARATFVGFGRTGTGTAGDTGFDMLKRAGQNTIDGSLGPEQWPLNPTFRNRLAKNARSFLVDFDNPSNPADNATGSATPLDLEYLISLGDSGGGAFIDLGSGPLLAGVHSFAEVIDGIDDSDYGDVTAHVRVSAHAKWIRATLRREQKAEATAQKRALLAAGGFPRILSPELSGASANIGTSAALYDSPSAGVVPEPASAAVLAFGAALLLRRRRRPVTAG